MDEMSQIGSICRSLLPECQVLSMFDWIKKRLFGGPPADPYDEFVLAFVAECRRRGIQPKSYDPNARGFLFVRDDASEFIHYMHNSYLEWLGRNQDERVAFMTKMVGSVIDAMRNSVLDPDKLPEQLMPGIRSHAQISNRMINKWIAGAPADDSNDTAFRPFIGDHVACAMRDLPDSMAQMAHANLAVVGLSLDQAMAHAMTNFRSRIPRPVFEPVRDGLFGCNTLQDHQSAMLLLTPGTDYDLPAIDGAPVAVVPTRNLFYLTGSESREGLAKALDLAQNANRMPWYCSSTLFQWDGLRWIEAELTGDLAMRQRELKQRQLADDYASQKELLDQYHLSKGQDIFVASQMLFRPKDSPELFTVAMLGSGTTGTLLPHADRLSFAKQVVDPQTGLAQGPPADTADVAWADAMAIAGHLFEPVPYIYPPRLRALGFPAEDVWARLNAVAR